jgi:hypothetical protein
MAAVPICLYLGSKKSGHMKLYFSDYFEVSEEALDQYGAFNISLVSDLPLFIDPFLLFNSDKPEYRRLHDSIIGYLRFLRDKSVGQEVNEALLYNWYVFKEVKQNWFGFTILGNGGSGLGPDFARALHSNLSRLFRDFGDEKVTTSSHLEKLCLIKEGVGRDNISDFTTNLIKEYLLGYTERFAQQHIRAELRQRRSVNKVRFSYQTESWQPLSFDLPTYDNDFVLLTPKDILTRDETWINKADLLNGFEDLPEAIPDAQLRAQVSNYFHMQLAAVPRRRRPTKQEKQDAARATIQNYPELIDYYIRFKEEHGDEAEGLSREKVQLSWELFVHQARRLIEALDSTAEFYNQPLNSFEEALARVRYFKHYVEHQDGYKLINKGGDAPFSNEKDVQLYFGLVWFGTRFDVNREPNQGRGPVDFKVSQGAWGKSLIEFKLASNKQLKRNLQNQVPIYEEANRTKQSVKAILFYTREQERRARAILKELGLEHREDIILIDARSDNKPSASNA